MRKYERQAQSQRKHGPLSVSGASKAPISPPVQRPGWKGPGYVKKRPSRHISTPSAPPLVIQEQFLPAELQQLILDIFQDTFPASKDFDTLKPLLHEINDALLHRDFDRAFGKEEYSEGYALRWSPSRSLAYANVMAWICDRGREEPWTQNWMHDVAKDGTQTVASRPVKALCFGGGAADVMAFAGLLRHLRPDAAGKPVQVQSLDPEQIAKTTDDSATLNSTPSFAPITLDLHLIDAADWSSVISKLQTGLTTPPTLSKYASSAARASNAAFLSSGVLQPNFTKANLFDLSTEDLRTMIGTDPLMITFLSTLNDLYISSIPKTTAFLRRLTSVVPKDSLLLVTDSPGACCEVITAKGQPDEDTQSYELNWLLDRALLPKPKQPKTKDEEDEVPPALWEKVVNESGRHHKLEEKLHYPASLENLKFQVHLFRRL